MTRSSAQNEKIQSPCIGQCCLDQEDVCVGCFRTMNEILNWTSSTSDEKLEVLSRCQQRRAIRFQELTDKGNKN